jgi:PAS domain S-box-containing protein
MSVQGRARAAANGASITDDDVGRALFDMCPDAIIVSTWDDAICRKVNPGFTRMTGWSADEAVGKSFASEGMDLWAKPADRERLQAKAMAEEGMPSIETVFRKKGGESFYCQAYAARLRRSGEASMLTVVRDRSRERRAETSLRITADQKGALSRELQHRVKNSLNVVSSLLSLGTAKGPEAQPLEVLASARSRVGSMAMAYDLVDGESDLESVDMSAYLRGLCASAISSHPGSALRIGLELDLDDVRLGAEKAVSVGLLVNELVSNSLTHAFPGERSGSVSVRIKRTKEFCVLSVNDDGIGIAGGTDSSGSMGLGLARALASQLGGSLSLSTADGVRAALAFPWPRRR